MSNLTTLNSHDVFMECLFQSGEPIESAVIAHGAKLKVGFHPDRLQENKEKIETMLEDLPQEFQQSGGGGWSFLNMCNDREGVQWADLHMTMDELLTLGLAIGKIEFLLPREMWDAFPGGMPYFVVKTSKVHG